MPSDRNSSPLYKACILENRDNPSKTPKPRMPNAKVQISNEIQSSNTKSFGFCNLTLI